jgi:hypothetical protein
MHGTGAGADHPVLANNQHHTTQAKRNQRNPQPVVHSSLNRDLLADDVAAQACERMSPSQCMVQSYAILL